jgi:AraC-like DNA-binding protein
MSYPVFYLTPLIALAEANQGQNTTVSQALKSIEHDLNQTHQDMSFNDFKHALSLSLSVLDQQQPLFLQALPYLSITSHGWVGMAALACPTLNASTDILVDFLPVLTPYFTAKKEENDFETTLYLERVVDFGPMINQLLVEITMATILEFGRQVLHNYSDNPRSVAAKLYFSHPTPLNIERYDKFFGHRPVFGDRYNKIILSNHVMNTPIKTNNPHTYDMLRTLLQDQLILKNNTQTCHYRVAQALKVRIQKEQSLSISITAADLAMSERTLRRRLREENTSFSDILKKTRIEYGQHLLMNSHFSIEKIALLVGFSNASTFSRVFKQVHQQSPLQYKKDLFK